MLIRVIMYNTKNVAKIIIKVKKQMTNHIFSKKT